MRILLAVALLASAAVPAVAETVTVGASGQCYDAAGNGGHDEARVSLDTAEPTAAALLVPSGTGAAAALVEFSEGLATRSSCPNPATFDYLEVDAAVGATGAQVCYGQGTLRTDGSCPRTPSGL
jgi:hypothetical protein